MAIRVNNIPKFKAAARAEMKRRLSRAVIEVSRHAKQLLSVPGTVAKGKGYSSRKYGSNPSRPGEPPHKQTGRLRASVAWELVDDDTARAGTNVKYGKYLELGTGRMKARPWLQRALTESQSAVVRHMTAPWNP